MANTFKSFTDTAVGTSLATAYTVPSGTVAVVIGLNVANITGNQINVDLKVDKASGDDIFLVKNIPIPNGASFEFNAGNTVKSIEPDFTQFSNKPIILQNVLCLVLPLHILPEYWPFQYPTT